MKTLKGDMEAHLNAMRLDLSRVSKMFPDPNAPVKAKGKANAKAQAGTMPAITDEA